MVYNETADLWYQYFMADGPQYWLLFFGHGIRAVFANLAACCNIAMVIVTVENKSLRGVVNILLAFESGCAIFTDIPFNASFIVIASGLKFIRSDVCFWILIPFTIIATLAQLAMILTGLDRLYGVSLPIRYHNRGKKFYTGFFCFLCVIYAIYFFVIYYLDYTTVMEDSKMSCAPNEIGAGSYGPMISTTSLIMSGILMASYTLIFIIHFILRKNNHALTNNDARMLKSLIWIVGFNLIGICVRLFIKNFLFRYFVTTTVFVNMTISHFMSFLTIAVYSANAPILYFGSRQYRELFNKQFTWLTKIFGKIDNNGSSPADVNNFTSRVAPAPMRTRLFIPFPSSHNSPSPNCCFPSAVEAQAMNNSGN